MSDTRRRRKQSGESDDLSDSYDELNVTKETQSTERNDGHRDSEYDTAGSDGDSDGGSQDGGERESGDGQEEDKPQKKLDDDEDRRNPQYIPKRGTFYEHDDRTTEEVSESTTEPPPERETKEKKVWKDKEDRWNHDRYNDDEQAPKSHEELIAVYGYDIRNEEGPPRARRRRRYGRGPNKYTRNWEDEDAYGKTAPSVTSGKNPGRKTNRSGEEFPALGGVNKDASTESVDEPVITSAWYSNKNKSPIKPPNFPPLQPQLDNNQKLKSASSNTHTNENRAPNEPTNPAWKKEPKCPTRNLSPNRNLVGVGGVVGETEKLVNVKPMMRDTKDLSKKRQVQESVSLAASRVRGRGFKASPNNNLVGNRIVDLKPKGRGHGVIGVDTKRNNITSLHDEEHQHLVNDTKHISLNDGSYHPRQTKNFYVQSPGQQRPNTVPPRMQQQQQHQQHHQQQQLQSPEQQSPQIHPQQSDVAGNRPKRYSSLRQRPTIPEGPVQQQTPYPPQHPQHGFYPPQAGNSHGVVETQGFPQSHFEQPTPVGNSAAPMTGQPVIPLAPGGQPASYAPPPFLVPPPQFITPQAAPPNIINYVPTPAGPPFQPNFQGYQGYNPTVPPQGPPPPPELFQPQGCTYYSPAQQQQQQGAPIRRPKAAIPILPPPDTSTHYHHPHYPTTVGRGKMLHHRHSPAPSNVSLTTSQSRQPTEQRDVTDRDTSELENKISADVYENVRYDETITLPINDEKLECLPVVENESKEIEICTESESKEADICAVTNETVDELLLKNESSCELEEIPSIPETPVEISSDKIVVEVELEPTNHGTKNEPPVVVSNEEIVVGNEEIVVNNEEVVVSKEEIGVSKEEIGVSNEEIVVSNKEIVVNDEKIVVNNEDVVVNNEDIVANNEDIVVNNEDIVVNNEDIVADAPKSIEIKTTIEKTEMTEREINVASDKTVIEEAAA